MRTICILTAAVAALAARQALAQGQARETEVRRDLQYATHDGVALAGDYYTPKAAGKYPVVIAVHGGGWAAGSGAVCAPGCG